MTRKIEIVYCLNCGTINKQPPPKLICSYGCFLQLSDKDKREIEKIEGVIKKWNERVK